MTSRQPIPADPALGETPNGRIAAGLIAASLILATLRVAHPAAAQAPQGAEGGAPAESVAAAVEPGPVGSAEGGSAFVIPIEGVINPGLVAFVRRGVEAAREADADQLIFEIDTEGGRVDSSIAICELIDDASPIPTTAYVRKKAWSGGALVSISADRIYMNPVGTIGSAAPVSVGPQGATALGEKYVAALRAEFRAWAERKGYPPALAVAMVDQELVVFEVEVDGERRFLTPDEIDAERNRRGEDAVVEIRRVIDEGKLLHLTASEGVATGFASGVVDDLDELLGVLGAAPSRTTRMVSSWSESLVQLITHPSVASLLLMAGLAGLYLEFKTPGFGVPGIFGMLALALLFGGGYLAGLAEVQEMLLFVLGLAFIVVELLFVPGFGLIGIAGFACLLVALVMALQSVNLPRPDVPWEMEAFRNAMLSVSMGLLGSVALVAAIVRFLPTAPGFRRLVLDSELGSGAGYTAELAGDHDLAGQKGVALSDLRPSGKIRVGEQVLDGASEGEYIEEGSRILVLRTDSNRILVKRA